MLSCYELYDLHAICLAVRATPADPIHEDVMAAVLGVLGRRESCHDTNQIRGALRPLFSAEAPSLYAFVAVDNVYTHFPRPFLKDASVYHLLEYLCRELLEVIRSRNTDRIADLADCLHNVPIRLVDSGYRIPRDLRKTEARAYRDKWDHDFWPKELTP